MAEKSVRPASADRISPAAKLRAIAELVDAVPVVRTKVTSEQSLAMKIRAILEGAAPARPARSKRKQSAQRIVFERAPKGSRDATPLQFVAATPSGAVIS